MAHSPSDQQRSIYGWFEQPNGTNLVTRARAGCGKTTTIIEGVTIAPDPSIILTAFNKRIADELKGRLKNPRAEAATLHGIGYRAVRRYWENIGVDGSGKRVQRLVDSVCGEQTPDAIKRLVGKLNTRLREMVPLAQVGDDVTDIAIMFDHVPDDEWAQDGFDLGWVCDRALEGMVLAAAEKPIQTGIDYADMLYLPLRNKWLRAQADLVVVDEAQDMTVSQLMLAQGICRGRIAIVGDDRQAIYGFRGADSGSLDRLKTELNAVEMGLTTTYRCGRSIVAVAQQYVEDFQAGPGNPEGTVTQGLQRPDLTTNAAAGDFILSRTNAPLVSLALGFVRAGKAVRIEGRDIGAGLKSIINKTATGRAKNSIPAWLERLSAWKEREQDRADKAKLPNKVEQIADQYETLISLSDGASGIQEILARLALLFDGSATAAQIVLSSIHRAKGLEADRVWVLEDTLLPPVACVTCRKRPNYCTCTRYAPDPMAQREEQNIYYVAVTRAKAELNFVIGVR